MSSGNQEEVEETAALPPEGIMKRKVIYSIGVYLCIMQMFFGTAFPCYASEIGTGAIPVEEQRPRVTSVSISPGTVVVSKNATCAFTASVSGENDYSREVAWSVSGQTSGNTFIDGNGVLNVASDEAAVSLVVKAVSKQDSNYSATALASIQPSAYYIQVQASPDNAGSVYGSGTIKEGGYVVISATPKDGFIFDGWLLNNNKVSQDARYVVDNIRADATYVAAFKPVDCRITVNVNDGNAGTATESRTVKYGESMTVEATPKEGYQFDSWTENGNTVSRDSRMEIGNITGDRTYTAVFKKKEVKSYTITASVSSANGTITPEGRTTVTEGTAVLYTITPKKGYAIRTVYVDGAEVGKTSSFNFSNVKGDHTISADFVEAPGQGNQNTGTSNKTDQADKQDNNKTDNADEPEKKPQDDTPKKEESDQKENEEPEEEKLTGTLASLQMTADEAKRLITEGKDGELLAGALKTGDLQMTVNNDFADGRQENFGVSGFQSVAGQLLSSEEKLLMLQGELPVSIELSIKDTEGKTSQAVKDAFGEKKLPGMTIGRYFEITLEETKKGEKETVSELAEKLKMVLHIPQPLQAEDRKFYVLGLHTAADGSLELIQLVDEDEAPDTITFSSDKFSPYAIAYIDWEAQGVENADKGIDENSRAKTVAAAVVFVMALIVTATGIWYIVGRKKN